MNSEIQRRTFLQLTLAGTAMGLGAPCMAGFTTPRPSSLISPGCRRSKVKVARIFMANPQGLWPKPKLNLEEEVRSYKAVFETMKEELTDVDFFVDQLVTSEDEIKALQETLKTADGILAIHLTIGIRPILRGILAAGRPTMVFAVPYSGHEWAGFGEMLKDPAGVRMDCMLTSDRTQLAAAVRPFRAIHHLREAKVLNVSTRQPSDFVALVKKAFGTEIKTIELARVVDAYNAVDEVAAKAESQRWIEQAAAVVEPSKENVLKSCRLALAFEHLLAEEDATVMTVDCYGTMWQGTIKLPAYPCLGFARLNNMGLGGICESDLRSAMTHILFQGLSGRPGFISDPTVDESQDAIILAHCLGTPKMAGPNEPGEPYRLRTVLERQEGVVPQVFMRTGERVTQSLLVGVDEIIYFTGEIIDAPDVDRGCRTKITVKVDGNVEKLWRNWSNGLHRVTCYGDVTKDMERFCRFTNIKMTDEAA
ncbi:MAG: hypothetical protein GXX96_26400 [Planctomycetaceae bacterium]|nr:hypothetical protein [Planctomycetaceae bacterium]